MYPYRLRRRPLLFLIVWAFSFSTSIAAKSPDSIPHVQVSLFDDAHLPPGTLAEAQSKASAIYAQAGIDLDWLVCLPADPTDFTPSHSPCSALSWPEHLSVRILPRGRGIASDVFGQAFVDDSGRGVYSNVYYANLASSPNHPGIGDGEMLGYVLAHELGHLLLGTGSHSPTGIMQATWGPHVLSPSSRPTLVFTSAQSSLIHSRLLAAQPVVSASSRTSP